MVNLFKKKKRIALETDYNPTQDHVTEPSWRRAWTPSINNIFPRRLGTQVPHRHKVSCLAFVKINMVQDHFPFGRQYWPRISLPFDNFELWLPSLTNKDITELGDGWVANMKWKILLCYKENPHLTPDDQEQCYLRAAGRWCRFLAQCSQQYPWNCKYGLWVAVGILTVGIFGIGAAPVCGVWWAAECSHLLGISVRSCQSRSAAASSSQYSQFLSTFSPLQIWTCGLIRKLSAADIGEFWSKRNF